MKKLYLSLIFLQCVLLNLPAQEYEYEPDLKPVKLKMGVFAGLSFPSILTTDSVNINANSVGINYGFTMIYGEPLFVRVDLAFNNFSSEVTGPDTTDASKVFRSKVGLGYFNVPIQLGYSFDIKKDKIKAWVGAGGFYEYLYRASDKELRIKRKDFLESGVGLVGSCGLNISSFTTRISYLYGLSPVLNNDYDSRKQVLSLSFGFRF